MTLEEISKEYEAAAEPIRKQLSALRAQLKTAKDPDEIWHIKHSISVLSPILNQMNDLAETTARYYDRSHYAPPKYSTINMVPSEARTDHIRYEKKAAWIEEQIGECPEMYGGAMDYCPSDVTVKKKGRN